MKKSIFLFIVPVAILSLALVGFNPVLTQAQTATTPVACPVGYTCTPVAPQPVNCPAGYICTPTNPSTTPVVPSTPEPIPGTPTPVYTCYVFSTNLQIGSTGADVVALQTWLVGNGFDISDISSSKSTKGYFGKSTYLALIKYQTKVGLPATGFFGSLTRAKLNASCGPISTQFYITLLNSNSGPVGSQVVIYGNNFKTGSVVRVSGKAFDMTVIPNVISSDKIIFNMPSQAISGLYGIQYDIQVSYGDVKSNAVQFTVTPVPITSQPSITVLSPNGGETYKNDGSPITVNWYTNNVPSSQKLDVIRLRAYPGGQEYNLASNVLNDGQEVIAIPSSIPVGAYTLEIKTYVNGTLVMDSSDSYFKIVSVATTQPSITVLSPNGGENFQTGGAIDIKWNSTGIPIDTNKADTIKIVVRSKHNDPTYSGGQIFEDWIMEKTANTGSYRWVIPEYYSRGVDASSFYVRVLLNSDTSVGDTSDRPFTITTGPTSLPMLTVTSPSAGSSYAPGNSIQINWTPKSPTSSFGLSLLKASDPSFLRLFFPTASNAGVNSWVIPSSLPSGSNYYVRVNEGVYRERTGYSGNFTITAPTPQPERQLQNTSSDLTSAIWDAIKEYYKNGGQ